jgi:hypothetical protein
MHLESDPPERRRAVGVALWGSRLEACWVGNAVARRPAGRRFDKGLVSIAWGTKAYGMGYPRADGRLRGGRLQGGSHDQADHNNK